MAKRSSTVYLEEMFWEMITQYQNNNKLSSRNDALAFMLKEWEMFNKGEFKVVTETPRVVNEVVNEKTKEDNPDDNKREVNPMIKGGLNQIFSDLKE